MLGRPDERRARREPAITGQLNPAARSAILGAFVVGSLWSAQAYQTATTSVPARAFITNARAALSAVPYGSVIADQRVPDTMMFGIFGRYSFDSKVIGAMAYGEPPSELRWEKQPAGTIDNLMVFGQDGTLREAAVVGSVSPALRPGSKCFAGNGRTIAIPFTAPARNGRTLRISYYDNLPGMRLVTVRLVTVAAGGQQAGGQQQRLRLEPGLRYAYLSVRGGAAAVDVTGLDGKRLCISKVEMGGIFPSPSALAVPVAGGTP